MFTTLKLINLYLKETIYIRQICGIILLNFLMVCYFVNQVFMYVRMYLIKDSICLIMVAMGVDESTSTISQLYCEIMYDLNLLLSTMKLEELYMCRFHPTFEEDCW